MKAIQPYLNFDGTCREAMLFYQNALGAELDLMPWDAAPGAPPVEGDRIIHARLHKGAIVLMASDRMPGMAWTLGNNFSVSIDCDSAEEQDGYFTALGEGGTVAMPLQHTFWGARFGMVTDRFGVSWMFNLDLSQN